MSRIRVMFGTMGAAIVLIALVSATQAQGPGGAGGGGGRGGRGGGPGGFGGGPGGFGGGPGGIYGLLDNKAVQEDLKLTDKQKEQIKTTNEAISKKRQSLFAGFQRKNNTPNADPNAADPNAGAPQPPDRETMMANMQALQAQTEAAFSKILTKAQKSRLAEIDLRRQGPMAIVRRPELAEKLNVSEDQMAQFQEIMANRGAAQQEARKASRDAFAAIINPQGADGGNGGGGGGRPNRAEMQKLMENPEVKSAMEKMQAQQQKQNDQLQEQTIGAIAKVLTKKQKNSFDKMLGKPFDVSKLQTGGPGFGRGGPGGPGGPPAAGAAATATDKTQTDTTSTPAKKKSTTKKGARKTAA